MERLGGIIELKLNGEMQRCAGAFSYRLSVPKRELLLGPDCAHGYTEVPMAGYIEGEITDASGVDIEAIMRGTSETVTLRLANGKTVFARDGVFVSEGAGNTERGNIAVRWESSDVKEA